MEPAVKPGVVGCKGNDEGRDLVRRNYPECPGGVIRPLRTIVRDPGRASFAWRRRAGSNRRIAVLQTAPLATWVRRHGSDYRRGSFRNSTAKSREMEECSKHSPTEGDPLLISVSSAKQEYRERWWNAHPAHDRSIPTQAPPAHLTMLPFRESLQRPRLLFPWPATRPRGSACP